MGYYLIEIVRVGDDQERETVARYALADMVGHQLHEHHREAWDTVDQVGRLYQCPYCAALTTFDAIGVHEKWHRAPRAA